MESDRRGDPSNHDPSGRDLQASDSLAVMEEQIRLIEAAHPDVVFTRPDGTGVRHPGESFGFIYRTGRILARHDAADAVQAILLADGHDARLVEQRPITAASDLVARGGAAPDVDLDLHQNHRPQMTIAVPGAPRESVPEMCRRLHDELGHDDDGYPAASPHHAFYLSPVRILCPATEPEEVSPDDPVYPALADVANGAGSRVAVLDTGFIRSAAGYCSWLAGVSDVDPDPVDTFDVTTMQDRPDRFIDPYAGHGTFITGIVRRIAPAATMQVRRLDIDLRGAFTDWPAYSADLVDEMHIADHIRAALWAGQQILSLSAGGPTLDNRPPLSFHGLHTLVRRHDAVLVAAAGNEGSAEPFWPAAFDWVVGVGALDSSGRSRALYSNFGPNADVYAPGTGIVNAYARGRYECVQPPNVGTVRTFDGRARWSGTSFATPVVAGLIAARMTARGEAARNAADALLALAERAHSIGGVGPTLRPEYTDLGW
jgi:Subtilase family